MRYWATILTVLFALPAFGCIDVVVLSQLLGKHVGSTPELDLTGAWQVETDIRTNDTTGLGGSPVYIKHLDNGTIHVALIRWDEDGAEFQIEQDVLVLTRSKGALYLHVPMEDSTEDHPRYLFFRLIVEDERSLLLLPPDADYFKTAVSEGELAGRVIEHGEPNEEARPLNLPRSVTVEIEAEREAVEALIAPDQVDEQFLREAATHLHRLEPVDTPAPEDGEVR